MESGLVAKVTLAQSGTYLGTAQKQLPDFVYDLRMVRS